MKRWELYIYAAVILLLNIPLLFGSVSEQLIFFTTGHWWQILTHPFVHVSWYHLLLDAVAFFVLYNQLAEPSRLRRTIYVAVCGLSSLLAAIIVMPYKNSMGYCGLSGIGHGLMAICALEMIWSNSSDKSTILVGVACLGLLMSKCLFEAVTGQMVFDVFHTDLIGSPVALAHSGGFLGGCIVYVAFNITLLNCKIMNFRINFNKAFGLHKKRQENQNLLKSCLKGAKMKMISCLMFLAFAATGCVSGNLKSDEPTVRVGIYDSRAVAVAYVHSKQFDDLMKSKMVEMENAKASGNTKKMAELEEWGSSHQATFHRQGFSTAPVDDIIEHINDKLPKITEDANAVILVSKWDKKTLKRYKTAELIDVTDQLVAQFNPDEKTLKIIKQLKEHKPIPLWKLEIMMKSEKHL